MLLSAPAIRRAPPVRRGARRLRGAGPPGTPECGRRSCRQPRPSARLDRRRRRRTPAGWGRPSARERSGRARARSPVERLGAKATAASSTFEGRCVKTIVRRRPSRPGTEPASDIPSGGWSARQAHASMWRLHRSSTGLSTRNRRGRLARASPVSTRTATPNARRVARTALSCGRTRSTRDAGDRSVRRPSLTARSDTGCGRPWQDRPSAARAGGRRPSPSVRTQAVGR